jgi:hypothetical protein
VGIALDEQYVYWISDMQGSTFASSIKRTPRGGGTSEVFSTAITRNVRSLVADDAMVYTAVSSEWDRFPANDIVLGRFQAFPKAGGTSRAIAQVVGPWAPEFVWGLAVDGGYVYFVVSGTHGKVGRISKDTGAIITLAVEQSYARSIAVDDAFVYWANGGVGTATVKKVRK